MFVKQLWPTFFMVIVTLFLNCIVVSCGATRTITALPTATTPPPPTSKPSATPQPDLVIYSGRGEDLIGPLIALFQQESGLRIQVEYGTTPEMASRIIEEGATTPADIYYGRDAGALGLLAEAKQLSPLPDDLLSKVKPQFRSPEGMWVGTSGRARTVIYHTASLSAEDLPENLFGFCDPMWKQRLGWIPTNASLHSSITAMRVLEGDERTQEWLTCIQANEPKIYKSNTNLAQAVGEGAVEIGFTNHYYVLRFIEEDPSFLAQNYYLPDGGAGALINVAGVGVVADSPHKEAAEQFIHFLLDDEAQHYFNEETFEYPLSGDVAANPLLTPLDAINSPELNLEELKDLDGTLQLMQQLGLL